MMKKIIFILLVAVVFGSCSKPTPKPVGYYRIEIPKNEYRTFADDAYPYQFQLSEYAQVKPRPDTKDDRYWIDIYYPQFDGTIYCSYKAVNNNFQEITEDTREFVYKHTVKADDITEQPFVNDEKHVYGILYRLEGNTASPTQFILTDSVSYLFRGALYFNAKPNKDSIAPVLDFINADIVRLVESFEMKKD
jgi:gliding motility-associated lipoprotein GldD